MAVRITASGGSNKLTSTTLKPTAWSFTAFMELDVNALGAAGNVPWRFENATVVQRIGLIVTPGGAFQIAKRDSLAASTTNTWFTDTGLATRGRITVAVVSDGTNAQGYYRRRGEDIVKPAVLALGTMSLAPESTAVNGILTAGGSDGTATYFNFLLYDAVLTEAEILAQMAAGLSTANRPARLENLIGWFPFKGSVAAHVNLASLTDLTKSGTIQDTSATNDDDTSWLLDDDFAQVQTVPAVASTANALFFGAGV